MKRKLQPRLFAMMAACALVANAAWLQSAHAQGMPRASHELVDTMRPMYVAQDADADSASYGGAPSGTSGTSATSDWSAASAMRGGNTCNSMQAACNIYFGH